MNLNVNFYQYLGLTFNYNGSYATAKKRLGERVQKALDCGLERSPFRRFIP